MGDKISQLPAATTVDGTELVPIVQGGATKRVTGSILRSPTGSAGGDLTGSYPNPTLAAITTAQASVGSQSAIPVISVDAKGRVVALSTVANPALTTNQIAGLSTAAGAALATAGVVGLSTSAARADHQHARPTPAEIGALGATAAAGGDLVGNYPNPTLAAITTAQSNVGSINAIPVVSVDSKGRVTALSSVAFSALTTNQIAGLSTAAPLGLAASAAVGLSPFAARADHQHPFPAVGGDLTGSLPNPTLAAITTAQSNVGSGTLVPVLSIDAKGRVTSLGSTPISGIAGGTVTSITAGTGLSGGTITSSGTIDLAAITTAQSGVGSASQVPVLSINAQGQVTALSSVAISQGGASLSTNPPAALATAAFAGLSTEASKSDHQHAFPTAAQVGALGATAAAGGDLTGNYPSPTLAAITTSQSNVGSSTAVPVLSVDAKGRVTSLTTAQISAGISALTGDVIASGTGSVTATLAAITTAQSNVGSASIVPILSIDNKGRVVALSSTSINASGGFTVASTQTGSLTVDSTYSQKIIPFQAPSPVAITLPSDVNANILSGSKIELVNLTTQEVRVLAGTGATVLSPLVGIPAVTSQNQIATATKLAANTWILDGNLNPSSVADPFFSNVSLLLHMNGVDGGTSFPDNSLNNYAVTVTSPGTTSTAQFRFGTASFLPAGGWLTAHTDNTPFAFGEGDFTIEFWMRITATGGAQRLVNIAGTTNYIRTNTSSGIVYATNSIARISSTNIGTNTWAHIAVSRVQGLTRMFVNGFIQGTNFVDTTNYTAAGPLTQIGGEPSTATSGNIDEFRVTKGVGRYIANFTPPTAQFPDL